MIPNTDREQHSGKYTITMTNAHGSNTYNINIDVQQSPSTPAELSLVFCNYTTIKLERDEPKCNGGLEITNYIFEKKDIEDNKWSLVTASILSTTYEVNSLIMSHAYRFPITNAAGSSAMISWKAPSSWLFKTITTCQSLG